MVWPNALIDELAARRCIVFLGAGASAGCISNTLPTPQSPPGWKKFLDDLIEKMRNKNDLPLINDLLLKDKFLEAAEVIKKNISPADYTTFIRETFVGPRYNPSEIHKAILKIDPKIVITTNYDDIYEHYCRSGTTGTNGYNVSKYYEKHIASDLKSPIRLIIKAHGCITDPSSIVLTKSEYFKARQDFPNFYKVLDALFLTHTIMFIGYSLNDPDIQLVLENVNISIPGAHPHYFVTEANLDPSIKEVNKTTYNIEFIEFPIGDYNALNVGMNTLMEDVLLARLRNPV